MEKQWNYNQIAYYRHFWMSRHTGSQKLDHSSNNCYDVMNCFAKFEKFLPYNIIIPRFMSVGSQMPELDPGAFCLPPPYKIDSQKTPYKSGLKLSRHRPLPCEIVP